MLVKLTDSLTCSLLLSPSHKTIQNTKFYAELGKVLRGMI